MISDPLKNSEDFSRKGKLFDRKKQRYCELKEKFLYIFKYVKIFVIFGAQIHDRKSTTAKSLKLMTVLLS